MIDSYFRKNYQDYFVEPLAKKLAGHKVSPQVVTAIAFACGIATIPLLYCHTIIWAVSMLLCSGYCDTLDGSIARCNRQATAHGAVFDIVSDRVVEFSIILGLYLYSPETRALETLLMLGSILICVTSFLVVGIFTPNDSEKSFHYSPGIMERAEAFCFFLAMMLFEGAFSYLAIAFTLLVALTALIRIYQFSTADVEKKSA